jgi:outer membrane protein insertion porin family
VIYQQLLEDFVVSIGGSAGFTQSYTGSQLRLTELFFVGGDNLRGFAVGGIGPRDANTGDALGGTYFYTGTTEASFPLGLPKEIGVTGKAFVDIGSLWGAQQNYTYNVSVLDNAAMRIGAGVGIQWVSPFGPIRVDYAWPIQMQYYDKTQNLRFGFGTRF